MQKTIFKKYWFNLFSVFFCINILVFSPVFASTLNNSERFNTVFKKIAPSYFIPVDRLPQKDTFEKSNIIALVHVRNGVIGFNAEGVFLNYMYRDNTNIKAIKKISDYNSVKEQAKVKTGLIKLGFINKTNFKSVKNVPELKEKTSARFNYFIGEKENWLNDIPGYKKLLYKNVWSGIDIEYLGYLEKLEYRVIVKPDSNPNNIVMSTGANRLKIDAKGNLIADYGEFFLTISKPFAYQQVNGKKVSVPVNFIILDNGNYGFGLGKYDKSKVLVIDPVLSWGTYLGGSSGDYAVKVFCDSSDNVWLIGRTASTDFPVSSDSYDNTYNGGGSDIFVSKLSADGQRLLYSTFLGGSSSDYTTSAIMDGAGNLYIIGYTSSTDFPVTSGAFSEANSGSFDCFIVKFSSDGKTLLYSTYLGGSNYDVSLSVAIDSSGNAFITGYTKSTDFPTTSGAFSTSLSGTDYDAFIAKINPSGSSLIYSTYLGGATNADYGYSVDVDSSGYAYVVGKTQSLDFPITTGAYDNSMSGTMDGFITKVNSDGSSLIFSTFFGGSSADTTNLIKINSSGNLYIVGNTDSTDLPVTTGAYNTSSNGGDDVYILEFDSAGTGPIYCTYFGGNDRELTKDMLITSSGSLLLTGYTYSTDFPTTNDAYSTTHTTNDAESFLTEFSISGNSVVYSTYIGGSGDDFAFSVAINSLKNIYVMGNTDSTDFPGTDNVYGETSNGYDDIFLVRFSTKCKIEAEAEFGGTISPNGSLIVNVGTDKTFTISPDNNFNIKDVLVDGVSVGAVSTYTFTNISRDHTITAQFEADTYTITATAGENGTISPSGTVIVNNGDDITFTIAPDENYFIADVIVDDESVGRVDTYTFQNVKANHTIQAIFSSSLPPVITETFGESLSQSLPFKADFTCNAYDPDGGTIKKFIWKIEGANHSDTLVTFAGNCSYTFTKPDTYSITVTVVDDEGETASAKIKDNSSQDVEITVSPTSKFSMILPLQTGNSGKFKAIAIQNFLTSMVNITDEEVSVDIKYYDSSGNNVATTNYIINPGGKFNYNPSSMNTENYSSAKFEADNYVLTYTRIITDTGQMISYLLPQFNEKLFISHIAEETDYWETNMFVSSLQPTDLKVVVNSEEKQYSIPLFSTSIDLEELLGNTINEEKTWGTVEAITNNPFGATQSLNGFEIFQHNNTDGAGVELQSSGSMTLFIPHIPEETDIFWTGFVIVNPNNEDANLTVELYSKEGQLINTVQFSIPAQSKLKGLAQDLFSDAYGNAEWGIILSDKDIFGIEIYGTVANGICGYSLPSLATTKGYLPELIVGENVWNGIAVTNPSGEEATITLNLIASDGTIKETKQITLGSMQRFKAVVKDFFIGSEIESTDYIQYSSSTPIIAIEVSGDLDRTFMFSLIGKE